MTCIVALARNGAVVMGCDSASLTEGSWDMTLRHTDDPKIVAYDDIPLLIGAAGTTRLNSLLRDHFTPPAPPIRDGVYASIEAFEQAHPPRRYVAEVVEAIKTLCTEYGLLSNDKPAQIDGCLLIGYQGKVYRVSGEFALNEPLEGFAATGCGEQPALGSLYTSVYMDWGGLTSAEHMVGMALAAAERFSAGVSAPFVIRTV